MVLSLKHVIDFIKYRWKLTKREIAEKYLICDHTKLSKHFYEDPKKLDEIFTAFFNLKKESSVAASQRETESKLLDEIKNHIESSGFKDYFEDIWNSEYENFVWQWLNRANTKHPKKTTLEVRPSNSRTNMVSQNKMSSEKILATFTRIVADCHIADFLNIDIGDEIDVEHFVNINKFSKAIKFDISRPSDDRQAFIIYGNIKKFISLLSKYKKFLQDNCNFWEDEMIYAPKHEIEDISRIEFDCNKLDYIYKLDALHRKINGGTSLLIPPRDDKDDSEFDKEEWIRLMTYLFEAFCMDISIR